MPGAFIDFMYSRMNPSSALQAEEYFPDDCPANASVIEKRLPAAMPAAAAKPIHFRRVIAIPLSKDKGAYQISSIGRTHFLLSSSSRKMVHLSARMHRPQFRRHALGRVTRTPFTASENNNPE
jgi:hypothetical protein